MAQRHIAVALDYSPNSKYAVTWALENIIKDGDKLLLIVVQKLNEEDGLSNLWGETGSPLISIEDLADPRISKHYALENDEELVQKLKTAAHDKHLTVNLKVYYGDPKTKISNAVVEHSTDALVMGNHGYGSIKRMLLGSVSTYVINNVPCSVTVVKLPQHN